MKTRDERSLKVLTDWNNGDYKCECQREASLQCFINDALIEQDRITRAACADAVARLDPGPDGLNISRAVAHRACIDVKAV